MSTLDQQPAVVAATDDGFAFPTAAMAASLAAAAGPGRAVELYIIDGGMSPHTGDRLRRALGHVAGGARRRGIDFNPHFLTPDLSMVEGLQAHHRISTTTYLRLLIPDLLPRGVRRALYVDGDVLVFDDVGPLFGLDLGGAPAAAVPSTGSPKLGSSKRPHLELGLDPDAYYMNAGVLLLDLDRWREERISAAVIEDLRAHQHLYKWLDQDGLNAVLANRWAQLPAEWNVQVGSRTLRAAPPRLPSVAALHFTGVLKPWLPRYTTLPDYGPVLASYRRAWFKAARQSGWYGGGGWALYRSRLAVREVRQRLGELRRSVGRAARRRWAAASQ
jgi:lipopolysaccharide biosynthesis glycosyltransferase